MPVRVYYSIYRYILIYIGVRKTYDRLHENYYSITEAQVEWVLARCAICTLQAANKGKPPIKPIKVLRCLHHLIIDLMDFSSMADGDFKWILQVKDPFSRYIWLYALKDKSAASVCAILKIWFGQNGLPTKL
jgi:hypothetical protein